ncbi:MAG TPA: PHP domain-containing protein [Syntrophales bacterium]|nr:PHP domain-containing protein [Syntrophales bacterium]
MIREFRCDFHVHTCLSPCADLDMYPRAVVAMSLARRLDIIAICDHNSSENVQYVIKCAEGTGLTVLAGMEITSSEEVHVLALFDKLENLTPLQDLVYRHLPGKNDEDIFGCQAIVNEHDEVEGLSERLLIGATTLPLQQIVGDIRRLGGLAIAAHIDRESFGILGQLGFIPEGLALDALEISRRTGLAEARRRWPELAQSAFVESSDSHVITDIGKGITRAFLEEASTAELRMAFGKKNGRYILE